MGMGYALSFRCQSLVERLLPHFRLRLQMGGMEPLNDLTEREMKPTL